MGKTLVAVMTIRKFMQLNPGYKAVFLVEQIALGSQQYQVIQKNLPDLKVSKLCGGALAQENPVKMESLLNELWKSDVIVSTAGAFHFACEMGYLSMRHFCCVILDEAHHCDKKHPYHKL